MVGTRNANRRQQDPVFSHPKTISTQTASPETSVKSCPERMSPSDNFTSTKPIIARFSKEKDGIRINAWINLFELIIGDMKSDKQKILELMKYVDGEALTWIGDEIAPQASTLEWLDVKEKMIRRFGQIIIRPLISAQKGHLRYNETIQKYYEEKMDMIRQTNMIEEDRVASLTDGMPDQYQNLLNACEIETTSSWLTKALKFETTISKKKGYRPIETSAAEKRKQTDSKDKKKPYKPCRFCQEKKGKELFHWHSDCRLNPANKTSQAPSAAATDPKKEVAKSFSTSEN